MTLRRALLIAAVIVFILGLFVTFGIGQLGMALVGLALMAGSQV